MKQYKDTPYYVDEDGNVFRGGRKLKQDTVNGGYKRVTFSVDGKISRHMVHRLVALLFIPLEEGKDFVNHIDNNRTNNSVSNLEWVTHSENMIHCHKQNRSSQPLATLKSTEVKDVQMEQKFSLLLGKNYLGSRKVSKRRYIKYSCFKCGTIKESRSDSLIFTKLPFYCVHCKGEDIV